MPFPFDVLSWLIRGEYRVSPVVLADGATGPVQLDAAGNVKVVMANEPVLASAVRQLTAANKGVLKSSPGRLVELTAWNSGTDGVYLCLVNRTTDPTNGDTALDQIYLPPGSSIGWRPGYVLSGSVGLAWAVSSTPGTVTLTGATVGLSAGVL